MASFASIAGSLSHTTSKYTGRYDEGMKVEPHNVSISAGIFSLVPNYLPPEWSAYTHPEGQLYFVKDASGIRVVTEAYIYDAKVTEKVEYWVKVVNETLLERQIVLSDDVELFIRVIDNDCSFYLVDHRSHSIFWLDTLDADEIGIMPVASTSHLMLALQELYWTHVEYFPVHLKTLDVHLLEELISLNIGLKPITENSTHDCPAINPFSPTQRKKVA
ncbi:hypothetical protein H0H92_005581 [Tricholoma furcatifolium]|nr:hypothetical protein H0H92_005581 [Tricholoma furcatifolium]